MHKLTGYADRWSVRQGETVRFMISSVGGKDFALRFVRHLCSDPNPAGPGYAEMPIPSAADGLFAGKEQPAYLGSFGHVVSLPVDLRDGVRLSATIWPNTPRKGRQGLVALRSGRWMFALCIGPNGGAMAEVANADGSCVRAEVPRRLLERRWYDVSAVLDLDGTLTVTQVPHSPLGDAGDAGAAASPPAAGMPEVFLAALPLEADGRAGCHYNGKLERPAVHRPSPANATLAAWDFAIGISTQICHRHGPARRPRAAYQPAEPRHDGFELDRDGARLEGGSRPIWRNPLP